MGGDSAEAQDTCSTANRNRRRSSFADMCQSASKRIGSQKDLAKQIRSNPVREPLSFAEGSSGSGRGQTILAAQGARESILLPGSSTDGGDYAEDFGLVGGRDRCIATTEECDSEKICGADELDALRELVERQKEDLETAASIGQQLLDSNDDLSTKLEAAREEKWLADCENEALRRDLEHATQRCEQLDDSKIEVAPEPDVEGFDLWSPAAAGGRGDGDATRPSISDDGSVSPMDYGVRIAAAADDKPEQLQRETEAEHLRRTIESLEQANSALREELVEARLETTALRHTSVAHEEAVRDQERREALAQDEDQQQNLGGTGLRASEKPWLGGGGGEDEPLRADETEEKVEHELLEGLTCVDREGHSRRASGDLSRGGETKEPAMKSTTTTTTTATTTAPARLLRCQSSSAFKDNEEQAELIDALREQVSQLRLQAQRTRASRGSVGERGARHGQNCATRYGPHACDCNTGPLRNHLPCSSDDDSGSDPGKSDVISDHKARSSCPKCARKERDGCEESGGDGKRTTEGGNAESGGGSGQADDPLTTFVLRERVSELSAELEVATRALDALRRRVEQEQAANLELQREILRLHVARHNGTQMSAEVARVSARASWPGPIHRTVYPDHGGGNSDGGGGDSGGQGSGNPIDCLKSHGMSWLSWLWRMFLGVREEDGTASGIEDRKFAGDVESEESGVDVRSVGRGREGNFVGGDDGGGENEGAWGHGDGRGIGGTRRSSTDERASFLNNEERKMV